MVGQSEYSLMPLRISVSWSTSTVSYLAPRRSRMAIARLEKPHCGNRAVPFMNRTMSFDFTMSPMRLVASLTDGLRSFALGHCRFELQCVKLSPYSSPEGGIDRLMLLDPAEADEALALDPCRIMV